MQRTSKNWQENQNGHLVLEGFVEISLGIADPDALLDAEATDTGSIYFSNTAQTVSEVEKQIAPYLTLEQNLWLLDGGGAVVPTKNYQDTGFIGRQFSDESGNFLEVPTVIISFSKAHLPLIPGLTITWSEAFGEYAESFEVVAYRDNAAIASKLVENNTGTVTIVDLDIQNYDKIVIKVLKWCLPNRRARIADIYLGLKKVYTKADLMGFEHTQTVDPLSASLSKMEIKFSVDNTANTYDPNNATGLSKYLMERQEIRARYGYKLGGGIEWIPAGVFYLSDWEAPQNGLDAKFTARDLLEFMSPVYMRGVYSPEGRSLYDLAVDVLEAANLPLSKDGGVKWVIDESLKGIFTTAPLPAVPISECLQLIAHAGCCALYADRLGILHISPTGTAPSGFEVNEFNSYSKTEIQLTKPLKDVEVKIYNYFLAETGKELFNGEIPVSGERKISIAYSEVAANVTAAVTDGVIESAQYFAHSCTLTLSGEGVAKVVVTGDILKTSDTTLVIANEEKGENQSVQNPLITSSEHGLRVGEWVRQYLKNRKNLSSDWRADPSVDALDIVKNLNQYGSNFARLSNITLTYNGAFSGKCEGRVCDVAESRI